MKLIEDAETEIKNKKKGTGRPCGMSRKNVSKESIVILEEAKDEEGISGDDSDDGEVVNV